MMMTHDERTAQQLASHGTLASTPEVWFDVSRGLVSPDHAAKAMDGIEDPMLIERSKVLFAPPSAERERVIREKVLEAAAPARPSRWWAPGIVALAAAVLLAFALRSPRADQGASLGVQYQVELSADWDSVRSNPDIPADTSSRVYRIDQLVEFTLRPSIAVDESELDVLMLAFGEEGDGVRVGALRRLTTTTGTVRFSERLDSVALAPGTWRLVFVVGRVGEVPQGPERLERGEPLPTGSGVVTRETIRVEATDEH